MNIVVQWYTTVVGGGGKVDPNICVMFLLANCLISEQALSISNIVMCVVMVCSQLEGCTGTTGSVPGSVGRCGDEAVSQCKSSEVWFSVF